MESGIPSFNAILRWGIKGGLGIMDQAIFSAANFLVSVFLARSLTSKDFGAFASGYAIVVFFVQIYTSFALEPMSVLGPSRHPNRLVSYLLAQVRLLFLLSIPIGLFLGSIIWLNQVTSNSSDAPPILIVCALSLPLMLFPLLMRRAFYVLLRPGVAVLGSVIYFVALLFIFFLATRMGALSGMAGILILSLAGLLSGSILLLVLKSGSLSSNGVDLKTILFETWGFSKWLILSGVLIGLATQSQTYLVGVLFNVEAAGGVRILQILIQPMMLTATAISSLAMPAISADFVSGAYRFMQRKMNRFTLVMGGITLFYELLLVFFGALLNEFLFQGKYSAFTTQIPVWGLIPVILSLFWGGVIALQASQKPQAMLIIAGFWALFSFVPGLILIPIWGAWGATVSILAGFIAALISTWTLYWQWVHQVYMDNKKSIE